MSGSLANLQIEVSLNSATPPIWRRLVIADNSTLEQLLGALQAVMGWENAHLHGFQVGEVRYEMPDGDDLDEDAIDESSVTIADAFSESNRGVYEYDFADGWEHELLVESSGVELSNLPTCLDGARACPPEESGGIEGYARLLAVLSDPTHEE